MMMSAVGGGRERERNRRKKRERVREWRALVSAAN